MVIVNRKGQASSEFMLVTGFLFVLLIPLIVIGFVYPQQGESQITAGQVTGMAIQIADAAEEVYYIGEPAKTTLKLYVPRNVEDIEIIGNSIVFKVKTINGITDVVETLPFNISGGNISTSEGTKIIKVESRGDSVWISE